MTIDEAIKRVEKAAQYAWYWSSFSPHERAKRFVDDFSKEIKEFSEEIRAIDPNSVDDFVKRYTDKTVEYLNAKSRTASAAVTGPAKFNYRKNDAALNREHELGKQLSSYFDYYKNKLDKRIKRETGYHKPSSELERQKAELKEAERIHQMNLRGNRILRKGGTDNEVRKMLKEIGVPDKDINFYLRERTAEGKFIFGFSSTNSNARKKRIEKRIKELERKAAAVGTEQPKLEFDNGYIIKNTEEDRLQILFDGIPPTETRTALKKNGYRWSPKQKAWQRKLTVNAVYSLDRLTGTLGIDQAKIDNWDNAKRKVEPIKKAPAKPKAKEKPAPKPIEHYENWWEKIIGRLMESTGLSRSDAQGMLQAKDFELTQQWGKGATAQEAYTNIFDAKDKPASKPATNPKAEKLKLMRLRAKAIKLKFKFK
jgi:hypothetical protein